MASDEFAAIGRASLLATSHIQEGDAVLKLCAPRVARQQCGGRWVDVGDDEGRSAAALVAEDPVDVMSDRELPGLIGAVDQCQSGNLHRVGQWHELQQIQIDAM